MITLRSLMSLFVLLIASGVVGGATPKEIDAAVQLGASYLKDQYKGATTKQVLGGANGAGAAALAGLALLEAGTPAKDESVRAITEAIREASFTATQTYHIALCLLYLDKLGDPVDVPLIQLLGVRLLAGQDGNGGWTYDCIEAVQPFEERELRRSLFSTDISPGKQPATGGSPGKTAKLHPEIEKYQGRLRLARVTPRIDDNSNTQFGVLALWVAKKHGVPAEAALELVEKRFLKTQTSNGGWPYAASKPGSPSMTCAGLLGLATSIARQEEQRAPENGAKTDPKAKDSTDKKPASRLIDIREHAAQKGLSALAAAIAGNGRGKGPRMYVPGAGLGERDLYFMWSVERVGVIYGLDKIGGIDWYDVGAEELVGAQNISGSWGRGGRGAEVDTAFAILFLVRSNPVKDLASQVQRSTHTAELVAGSPPGGSSDPITAGAKPPAPGLKPPPAGESSDSRRPGVIVIRPNSQTDDPKAIAAELVAAMGLEWDLLLTRARDASASYYTQAMVIAIGRLEGDRLKQARDALAERLTRASAGSLRTMAKAENAELRRAAVLAMKSDKKFLADLIAAILDEDEQVVSAARAGLKNLTDQDFGPMPGANNADRKAAAQAWKDWLARQKK